MSKLTLTAVMALVIFLVGAGVVWAQGTGAGYGMRMMQAPGVTTPTDPNSPNAGNGWICPLASGDGTTPGPGMMQNLTPEQLQQMRDAMNSGNMGQYMQNLTPEQLQQMRDAMNSGSVDQMQSVCGNAMGQATQGSGSAPQTGTTPQTSSRSGMMGGRTGGMMGSRA